MASALGYCEFDGGVVSLEIVLYHPVNKSRMVSQYRKYMATSETESLAFDCHSCFKPRLCNCYLIHSFLLMIITQSLLSVYNQAHVSLAMRLSDVLLIAK